MTTNFKAVLFDLDGTILDSLADLADSMNAVLERFGFPTHPAEAYKYFVGDGMDMLAWRVLPPEAREPRTMNDIIAGMRKEYGMHWKDRSTLYAGIPELLTALAARGLKLAIFSNKPDDFTRTCVNHFLHPWNFAAILGASPETPKKPDPTGALHIADTLAVLPDDFLYLGDTATDMETAAGAGMHAIGALWGFRTAGELLKAGARRLIAHPAELLDIL